MNNRTPLYKTHVQSKAKIVDFFGWDMPVHYGSQIDEHHAVRQDAGMFDVSHMVVSDIKGPQAREFLSYLLANDVGKLKTPGKALYTCMLNEDGGIIDDLIVYFLHDFLFRMVTNAGTRTRDFEWINQHAEKFAVEIEHLDDVALIAVQGPNAVETVVDMMDLTYRAALLDLKPFNSFVANELFFARTGYTGEDGFEIMIPAEDAEVWWQALLDRKVRPTGLGARDTLRLEAGMCLYGADMDESTSPFESNLGWTVALEPRDRNFIGRVALEKQQADGVKRKLVGLVLEEKGVLRDHQKIWVDNREVGEITSGSFSPSLNAAIALARVESDVEGHCNVEIRGKRKTARIVKPTFVRKGQACIELPKT